MGRELDTTPPHPTILGIPEISELTGISRAYLDTLRHRGKMPAPSWRIGGRPAWERSQIEAWHASRSEAR